MDAAPDSIIIRGAREHNLKNISVDIPLHKLVVITGPSGSGKSSLAFDTLFAEGQRRYMESLSAYARQFLEQMSRPEVDLIDGLSPAIAIEQKTISSHPRSTVGTVTGIYDFLRLLYARVGEVRDPITGETLKAHSEDDIVAWISEQTANQKIQLFASVVRGRKGEFLREFEQWRKAGFSKVRVDGKMLDLHDPILIGRHQNHEIELLLDTVVAQKADTLNRVKEAIKLSEKMSEGWLRVVKIPGTEEKIFSRKIASSASNTVFPDIEPRIFSFNSPYGMCPTCKGLGMVEKPKNTRGTLKAKLSEDDEEVLFDEFDNLEACPACQGARLRPESLCIYFCGHNIHELSRLGCVDLLEVFKARAASYKGNPVAERLVEEISIRLKFLDGVGVGYLSMERRTNTLSGGEAQRIRLATQLGSQLSGVLYVLDEPSIGLHPQDHQKLLKSLVNLRNLGNTVVVVEHDEETMLSSDYMIDIGPGAGVHGGKVVSHGTPKELMEKGKSQTAKFLRNEILVTEKRERRPGNGKFFKLHKCRGHNLKNISLNLPLGKMVVFTGVSGSGKSSLVNDTLEAAISKKLYRSQREPLAMDSFEGIEHIDKMVHVDQKAIGRSPRSNPATYTGLFSALRSVYAQTPDAQIRGYTAGTFSFNVKGGRCDACEGGGRIKIEMHFLPDVYVPCEVCNGTRYRREVLEVRFKGKNISEVLNMSVEEAVVLFENQPLIEPKLRTLVEVGLGYVKLGQGATTLSGGEAQRIKLAKELSKKSTGKTFYFLDEPTTGLHFEDVKKLLELLQRLCDLGNTVVIIEHNLDVVAAADYVFDLGPGPGRLGGEIVAQGTPEELAQKASAGSTATFVREYFKRRNWAVT